MKPLFLLLILGLLTATVLSGKCYDNWSRCTPQTAFATGIVWKDCSEYSRKCKGRAYGECVKVNNLDCSGGYQCQDRGGTVEKSKNPIDIATCALGL